MKRALAVLTVLASAALAWAALPADLPATYSIRETDRLDVIVAVAGHRVTRHRTVRTDGDLTLDADGTLRLEDPEHLLPANEATWWQSGRSSVRFRFTQETKDAIQAQAVEIFARSGIHGVIRVRYRPGRLVFSRDAGTFRGSQVVTGTVRGRYAGRPVTAWATVHLRWRGTRKP
jgi:hypothetical protein